MSNPKHLTDEEQPYQFTVTVYQQSAERQVSKLSPSPQLLKCCSHSTYLHYRRPPPQNTPKAVNTFGIINMQPPPPISPQYEKATSSGICHFLE